MWKKFYGCRGWLAEWHFGHDTNSVIALGQGRSRDVIVFLLLARPMGMDEYDLQGHSQLLTSRGRLYMVQLFARKKGASDCI